MRAPKPSFANARRHRRALTLPEVQLWQHLRGAGLGGIRFRRQHPIGPYVLDFYAPTTKLAVEVDGAAYDVAEVVARDTTRDAWLAGQGVRVLRINAVDVLDAKRREDVLATIVAAICVD